MIGFVLRRLVQAIPVMFLASVGVFMLLHLLPGDPAILMAGADAPEQTIEFVRHDMGLDQPLPIQYAVWVGHILRGDVVSAGDKARRAECSVRNLHVRCLVRGVSLVARAVWIRQPSRTL